MLDAHDMPSLPLLEEKNSRCCDTIQYVQRQYDRLVKPLRSAGASVMSGLRSLSSTFSGTFASHPAISVSGVVPQRTPNARSRCCRCHHNLRRLSVSTGLRRRMAPSRWIPKASALRIVRPMSENKLRMLNRSMEAACGAISRWSRRWRRHNLPCTRSELV